MRRRSSAQVETREERELRESLRFERLTDNPRIIECDLDAKIYQEGDLLWSRRSAALWTEGMV